MVIPTSLFRRIVNTHDLCWQTNDVPWTAIVTRICYYAKKSGGIEKKPILEPQLARPGEEVLPKGNYLGRLRPKGKLFRAVGILKGRDFHE